MKITELIGRNAPDFTLQDKDENEIRLNDIKSDYIVLYFYPKDNTPGCTLEAKDFENNIDKFKSIDTEVIGISGGTNETKKKFCEKNELSLILLSDSDFIISKNYGVYQEKSFMGKKFYGIKRTTFILDKKRNVIKIYENVKPINHANKVLNDLKDFKNNINIKA